MTISLRMKVWMAMGVVMVAASIGLAPRSACAYYDRLFVSSRTHALGGAFVAIGDDPSATVANPAGLTQSTNFRFLSSLARPYGISDLEESFIAVSMPAKYVSLGVSWHRFALRDATAEDLFTIAVARDLVRTSEDASLAIGGSLDIARVSYTGRFEQSQTKVTGSLSVLLRPFPIIGFGYNARNLGQPAFDLIEGGGKTPLHATHAFGLAYHWQGLFVANYERSTGQDRRWSDRLGVEINAGSNLRLRSGLTGGQVSGGVGIIVSGVTVDAAMTSHRDLGSSYLISIGFGYKHRGYQGW